MFRVPLLATIFAAASRLPQQAGMHTICLHSVAVLFLVWTLPAMAGDQLPTEFVGTWWPVSSDTAQCPSPLPDGYGDTALSVTEKKYEIYESAACELLNFKKYERGEQGIVLRANFTCGGMGDVWREHTMMHLRQDLLIITTIEISDWRDDSGLPVLQDKESLIGSSVWRRCHLPRY